jgi:non-lysosomal glucosylceramidase
MASLMGDASFESKCLAIASRGEKNSVSRLWNGQYFFQDVDLKAHPQFQYADGCLSDQLFGQTWAHLNNLGYIYPKENVRSALQAIWDYNWAPDVEAQNKNHPPERTYASAGESGLLVASWPYSQHMGEDGVRYRDEVWTGIEYQVATNMIYEDMMEEGLSIVKAVHDRYSPEKHNPWNEIECGDHYARAMASWGVLLALQDYHYNGPEMRLGFHPKISKQGFRSFFTAAEGWGNISQSINGNKQSNELLLRYGKLKLKEFEITPLSRPASFEVMLNGKKVKSEIKADGKEYRFVFDAIELKESDRLSVTMTF